MPELALHFSVVFALVAPRLGVRRALFLSSIALLPDLDVLFHVHRSMSHSILVLLLVSIPISIAIYKLRPKDFNFALFGLLALLSHPLLDCFQTYTPILYPLLNRSLWIKVDGNVLLSPGRLSPQISANVRDVPTIFKPFKAMDAPIFTSDGFLISSLLVVVPALLELSQKMRKKAH